MSRWYEHWLRKAHEARMVGDFAEAVRCLGKAESHTYDADELQHLTSWKMDMTDKLQQQQENRR